MKHKAGHALVYLNERGKEWKGKMGSAGRKSTYIHMCRGTKRHGKRRKPLRAQDVKRGINVFR